MKIYGRNYEDKPLEEWLVDTCVALGYKACYSNEQVQACPFELCNSNNWNDLNTEGGKWYKGYLLASCEIGFRLFTGEVKKVPSLFIKINDELGRYSYSDVLAGLLEGWLYAAQGQELKVFQEGYLARKH